MGHEYDCDKPPYEVPPCLLDQAGHPVQTDREVADMGFYVALVAFQVEACARLPRHRLSRLRDQTVQGIHQARDGGKVGGHGI